jgi:hypothetical protein
MAPLQEAKRKVGWKPYVQKTVQEAAREASLEARRKAVWETSCEAV